MYIVKQCTKCEEYKLLCNFQNKKNGKFGKHYYCKLCTSQYKKQYRKNNKDYINQYNKQFIKKKSEEDKKRAKEYQEQYRKNNKQRIKQWREDNKLRAKQYQKNKREKYPLYKMICNIRNLVGSSMKRQGYSKSSKTHKILGCDYETFKKHIERQFTKGMNWNNQGEWHYDHIIPISSAQTEEEVIKLNHYTNFQPLWAEDNLIKSNKIEPTQIKLRI
jgi:hypothetical protein